MAPGMSNNQDELLIVDPDLGRKRKAESERQRHFVLGASLFHYVGGAKGVPGYRKPFMKAASQRRLDSNILRSYIQQHGPFVPSKAARRAYLQDQPPDGTIQWWRQLASSEMIARASPHIKIGIPRIVEALLNPVEKRVRGLPYLPCKLPKHHSTPNCNLLLD